MEINYALIERIRETRKQRGLSAEELAEIADLSTVYISYIEMPLQTQFRIFNQN